MKAKHVDLGPLPNNPSIKPEQGRQDMTSELVTGIKGSTPSRRVTRHCRLIGVFCFTTCCQLEGPKGLMREIGQARTKAS